MVAGKNPIWAELIQLMPVITLALPFIVAGTVDMGEAGTGFLVGGVLAVVVTVLVEVKGHLSNPILVGTGLWLLFGALAFNVPIPEAAQWLSETQALGLFLAAFVVGVVATFRSRYGYVGCPSGDAAWVRKASLGLLALTAVCIGWGWVFRQDVRLGGGLPFIVLNVARRVLIRRAPA
jgi:hypothetical protein